MSNDAPVPRLNEDLEKSIAEGYTLPAAWYTSRAVFDLEMRKIFRHAWQYAGTVDRVQAPGDFVTYQAGAVPILILRDAEGQLRAFINVCRHRGAQLVVRDRGTRQSIQCHYHAWTYDLDGSLRAVPGAKEEGDFDLKEFSLLPARVETWGPFLFVNPDCDAPPLMEYLGELPELVAATGLNLDAVRCRERRTYNTDANWKVVVDNYLECYHCPVAHPSFTDLIDLHQYYVHEYEYFSVQGGPIKSRAREKREQLYSAAEGVEEGMYVYLWPNFMLNIYPGPGNVSLNLILPTGVERSTAVYEFCFVDSVSDAEARDFAAFVDQVQREDIVLCESVQRGLKSGYFHQGKLMLSRESAVHHFEGIAYRELSRAE